MRIEGMGWQQKVVAPDAWRWSSSYMSNRRHYRPRRVGGVCGVGSVFSDVEKNKVGEESGG